MSSSAASTHQLGRQFWASIRDSVDAWLPTVRRTGPRRSLRCLTRRPPGRAQAVVAVPSSQSLLLSLPSLSSLSSLSSFSSFSSISSTSSLSSFSSLSSLSSLSLPFAAGRRLLSLRAGPTAAAAAAHARISPTHVRRSCTSGGLLLLGLSSPTTPSSTVVATCTAAADTALSATSNQPSSIGHLVHQALQQRHRLSRRLPNLQNQNGTLVLGGTVAGRGRLRVWAVDARRYKSTDSSGSSSSKTSRDLGPATAGDRTTASASRPPSQQHQPPPPPPSAQPQQHPQPHPPEGGEHGEGEDAESIASSMSKYLQSHLPKIPHRPTKEELLAAANSFSQRLKVRLKWITIRSMRPWNADEWGAFLSWFMLGHLVWILVGTTTFVSLIILTINTVFAQEKLARWVGDYLTQSAGVTVIFESAIVPKWKDGVITFRNVFVSRRPGQIESSVTKGSPSSAAAIAAARHVHEQADAAETGAAGAASDAHGADGADGADDGAAAVVDDGNYTQFDVTINSVDVTLSFYKWWNGKGLLKDVEVRGVRGVIDRTFVHWAEGPLDPFSFRHEHQPGDFEIERFKLEDLMVTVYQPNGFRPFSASIFSCELPQLRKQWLFYDFLCANHVSGAYDGSLFTIHPRQVQHSHIIPGVVDNSHHNINNPVVDSMTPESALAWKKFSRLRIDGLKIDHLNRGDPGPFGWIYEGNVDIVADVMLPAAADASLTKVMSDFYDKMEEAVTSNRYIRILDGNYGSLRARSRRDNNGDGDTAARASDDDVAAFGETPRGHLSWTDTESGTEATGVTAGSVMDATTTMAADAVAAVNPIVPSADNPRPQYVIMDLRMHLNDVRAAVPFFPASDALGQTRAQSYVNAALIRPIVAYINAKRTYIPISCRVVKHLSDFDGSWTTYDCGLMDDTSAEVYAAFAADVEDQQSRVRRLKKVGFWTLSMVVHALLAGVAGDLM